MLKHLLISQPPKISHTNVIKSLLYFFYGTSSNDFCMENKFLLSCTVEKLTKRFISQIFPNKHGKMQKYLLKNLAMHRKNYFSCSQYFREGINKSLYIFPFSREWKKYFLHFTRKKVKEKISSCDSLTAKHHTFDGIRK